MVGRERSSGLQVPRPGAEKRPESHHCSLELPSGHVTSAVGRPGGELDTCDSQTLRSPKGGGEQASSGDWEPRGQGFPSLALALKHIR